MECYNVEYSRVNCIAECSDTTESTFVRSMHHETKGTGLAAGSGKSGQPRRDSEPRQEGAGLGEEQRFLIVDLAEAWAGL